MLGLFRKEKPYEQEAKALYAQCLIEARKPVFVEQYDIADTMEARFDLLTLHAFLIIDRTLAEPDLNAAPLNQALFDTMFVDMDQTMREMGIGDMGIPKRMKKMMTGFNGRMHSYETALKHDNNKELALTLSRNLYASESLKPEATKLAAHIRALRNHLKNLTFDQILQSESLFSYE